jgi:hypothetical protein
MGALIWPLRAKLTQSAFLQQRPRFTGGRKIPERPTSPWGFKKRSLYGKINFGQYDQPPVFRDFGGDRFPLPLVVATSSMRGSAELRLPPLKKPKVVSARPPPTRPRFSGFSLTNIGGVLSGCDVVLYRTDTDAVVTRFTTGADGSWLMNSNNSGTHYLVAYKAGSPDVAGTTLDTLRASDGINIYLRNPTIPESSGGGMSRSRVSNA